PQFEESGQTGLNLASSGEVTFSPGAPYYYTGLAAIDAEIRHRFPSEFFFGLETVWKELAGENSGGLQGYVYRGQCFAAGTKKEYEILLKSFRIPDPLMPQWQKFQREFMGRAVA